MAENNKQNKWWFDFKLIKNIYCLSLVLKMKTICEIRGFGFKCRNYLQVAILFANRFKNKRVKGDK